MGTAEPLCFSIGVCLVSTQNPVLGIVRKGCWGATEAQNQKIQPSDDQWLLPCFLLSDLVSKTSVAARGLVQGLAVQAQQSSVCIKHTKVSWDAPGGFVKVLFADRYIYIISSEIERVH